MDIIISSKSKQPIYDQIYSQIKTLILTNELKVGDALPGIRPLASSLKVSVITVKKAYELLQRDEFIDSSVGRGSFVAPQNLKKIRNQQLIVIEEYLTEAVLISKNSGIKVDELTEMLKNCFEK